MRLDDRGHDGQTQSAGTHLTRTRLVGPHEPAEQGGQDLLRNAGSVILDGKAHVAITDSNAKPGFRSVAQCVADQVLQGPLDRHGVRGGLDHR